MLPFQRLGDLVSLYPASISSPLGHLGSSFPSRKRSHHSKKGAGLSRMSFNMMYREMPGIMFDEIMIYRRVTDTWLHELV